MPELENIRIPDSVLAALIHIPADSDDLSELNEDGSEPPELPRTMTQPPAELPNPVELSRAVADIQERMDIAPTGELDAATYRRLFDPSCRPARTRRGAG